MADPVIARTALRSLVEAFESHLAAAEQRTGEADPVVFTAYARLAGAFVDYEEAVYELYDEVVPMSLLEDDDEDDDEDEDDEDDDLEALDDDEDD